MQWYHYDKNEQIPIVSAATEYITVSWKRDKWFLIYLDND